MRLQISIIVIFFPHICPHSVCSVGSPFLLILNLGPSLSTLNPLFFLIFIVFLSVLIPSRLKLFLYFTFVIWTIHPCILLITSDSSDTCPCQHLLLLCPWPHWWAMLFIHCVVFQAINMVISLNSFFPHLSQPARPRDAWDQLETTQEAKQQWHQNQSPGLLIPTPMLFLIWYLNSHSWMGTQPLGQTLTF